MKKNDHKVLQPFAYLMMFLVGGIMFWTFGNSWLDLKSTSVFAAGLTGVAVVVLAFAAWNIFYSSHHKEN